MPLPSRPASISAPERHARLGKLRENMEAAGFSAVLIGATESLRYLTGLVWHQSERLLGVLVTPTTLTYIVPSFERSRVESLPHLLGEIATWEEEESPARLIASLLRANDRIALDDALPLFTYHELVRNLGVDRIGDGARLIRDLRLCKSAAEIALIQYAMDLTLEVHKRAHAIMAPGIRASDVVRYIDRQHRELGASGGSTFCIVSFGTATSLPHGSDGDQVLEKGQAILVDTGTRIDGYHSDLTRTYMLEEADAEFERVWSIEREAQQAVFEAAQIGVEAHLLDDAARAVLVRKGLGPDYRLPGLPHRAGHGLGLEIHEEPYIVRGNDARLRAGMCFSNEPMIVVPGQFGIRLEDHIFMSDTGPHWFTQPATGPTKPFA